MLIEYDLLLDEESRRRGIINAEFVRWVQVDYPKSIVVYYDGTETKIIFMSSDDAQIEKAYEGFKLALAGMEADLGSLGFIKPVRRPAYWGENDVVVPLSSELNLDNP